MRLFAIFLFCLFYSSLFSQLPNDFFDEVLSDNWNEPVGLIWDEEGRGYVWDKSGQVFIISEEGIRQDQPFVDIREEVQYYWDHGLVGFALDPNFYSNGYVYLLYVVDPHYLDAFGTSNCDPNVTRKNEAAIGRLIRLTANSADGYTSILPNSKKILMGEGWTDGMPVLVQSHGVCSIAFGTDGTLLVSLGDAGAFSSSDRGSHPDTYYQQGIDLGIIRPEENVGAYRSQMMNSLSGKILRLDPETGPGLPSNPFFDPLNPGSIQSRIWARGLRNPYGLYKWPDTGSHLPSAGNPGRFLIADVGSNRYEEINFCLGGENFGWPLFEGYRDHPSFQDKGVQNQDTPNPLLGGSCNQAFFTFEELIEETQNPCDVVQPIPDEAFPSAHTPPVVAYRSTKEPTEAKTEYIYTDDNDQKQVGTLGNINDPAFGTSFIGNCALAGALYTGDNFPEEYHGKYFAADWGGWIRVMEFNEDFELVASESFHTDTEEITAISVHPTNGCLYYVAFRKNEIHRVCFGGDPAPVAVIEVDQQYGVSPLTVQLDASDSFDPQNQPISVRWLFEDGSESTEMVLSKEFSAPNNAPFTTRVQLEVTDTSGQVAMATQLISLNNTPPVVEITSIPPDWKYPMTDLTWLPLKADAFDAEHSVESLSWKWQLFLQHDDHEHPIPADERRETFTLIEPIGCELEETYNYRLELTVTDPNGLATTAEQIILPYCDESFGRQIILIEAPSEEGVGLRWDYEGSDALDAFFIQRSTDGRSFLDIGSTSFTELDFVDENPPLGVLHYRIRGSKGGQSDYSNRILVDLPTRLSHEIRPNPVNQNARLILKKPITELIQFRLYDASGKLMRSFQWTEGQVFDLPLEDIGAGVYVYQLESGMTRFTGKIVKH